MVIRKRTLDKIDISQSPRRTQRKTEFSIAAYAASKKPGTDGFERHYYLDNEALRSRHWVSNSQEDSGYSGRGE